MQSTLAARSCDSKTDAIHSSLVNAHPETEPINEQEMQEGAKRGGTERGGEGEPETEEKGPRAKGKGARGAGKK